ncbi:MAG: enoyl-CoA hydratase/isomerase family protein [Burkholderiaceae bacterium]
MPMQPPALIRHDDHSASTPLTSWVELNRPEVANALGPPLAAAIHHGLTEAIEKGQKLFVLKGLGRHFCAGFDFSDLQDQTDESLRERFIAIEKMLQALSTAPLLTVACIEGAAFGAGADLAVACRLRMGTGTAKFKFPGSRFGLVLGSRRLGQCAGADRAIEILANNETVLAEQALKDGLLTHCFADATAIESQLSLLAKNLESLDPITLQALLHETSASQADQQASGVSLSMQALKDSMRPGLKDRIQAFRASAST